MKLKRILITMLLSLAVVSGVQPTPRATTCYIEEASLSKAEHSRIITLDCPLDEETVLKK